MLSTATDACFNVPTGGLCQLDDQHGHCVATSCRAEPGAVGKNGEVGRIEYPCVECRIDSSLTIFGRGHTLMLVSAAILVVFLVSWFARKTPA